MIGTILHLGACALDDARECARDLGWVATFATSAARLALASRLDPEAARAVGEVAALRAERDLARLEHAAAVEVCDELKELLATARTERDEARGAFHQMTLARDILSRGVDVLRADCNDARNQLDALATPVKALVDARRALDTAPAAERSAAALALRDAWKPVCDLFPEEVAAPDLTDDGAPRG